MEKTSHKRRDFIKGAALVTGLAAIGGMGTGMAQSVSSPKRLPREVWIAGVSQDGMQASTSEEMVDKVIRLLGQTTAYRPDLICLPEVFPVTNVSRSYGLEERVAISNAALDRLAVFAKENSCYMVAPLYTQESGFVFNAAVLLDRNGKIAGEYRKIYLPADEMELGLMPGPFDPPVFETDFGKLGIQICFDIVWEDGWKTLKDKGAEVICWPSAYGGGQHINMKALQYRTVLASSTQKGISKLCDVTGEEVIATGLWDRNLYCAPVNLEKIFMHTWPYVQQFGKIREKYGREIRITTFHQEEWSVIESLSPDIQIQDIAQEFGLKSYDQHKCDSEQMRLKAREKLDRKA